MEPAPAVKPSAAPEADKRAELRDRMAVSVLLLPFVFLIVQVGGWLYLIAVLTILLFAAIEFGGLFITMHQRPAVPLLVAGVALLVAAEQLPWLNPWGLLPVLIVLAGLAWHLLDYERGAPASGTDFVVTMGGIFYLGLLGRCFVALRAAPDGMWWLLTVLGSVFLADTGAYSFGRLFGRRFIRRPLAPRLSPKKTWEGLAGSVLIGALGAGLLGLCWQIAVGPASLLNWQTGVIVGALVGLFGQLGDLGVSMFKRQAGVKDTGALMAGHGGALDRIDSWLVAMAVGYYYVQLLAVLAVILRR
jgi:phosphatidate cytidylyltransferase